MFFLALLACPGSLGEDQSELLIEVVRLEVGTDGASIGPDATLRFDANLVQRSERSDAIELELLSEGPFLPIILDESGARVQLVSAPDPTYSEAYNSEPPSQTRLTAEGGFAPGQYSIEWVESDGWGDLEVQPPLRFEIQPTASERELLAVGDTFLVQDYRLHGLEGLLQDSGSSWIRVAETDGARSRLELIIDSDYRCVAVNAWTDWSGDGSAWSQDSLSIQQEDLTLTGYGIFTNLPLSEDGSEILSGQAHMVVDMSGVDQLLMLNDPDWDWGESCGLISGFGLSCGDCLVGEPGSECLTLSLLDLNATRISEQEAATFGSELPPCGVDLADIEAPVLDLSFLEDMNFDCGCTTAAGFSSLSMAWLAMALVRTRRRRKQSSARSPEETTTPAG